MAAFYADENFPREVVEALRDLGHDVLTALEAGQANQAIPDEAVIEFAGERDRAILTLNRWQFIGRHKRDPEQPGWWSAHPTPTPAVRPTESTKLFATSRHSTVPC